MNRKEFLQRMAGLAAGLAAPSMLAGCQDRQSETTVTREPEPASLREVTLFLCGDVMTGRGIDQALPHPGDPLIHEARSQNAQYYVQRAEEANGPFERPVAFPYIWGRALEEFQRVDPPFKLINLETSITTSDEFQQGKRIHYRMSPRNVDCLTAAHIDCCALANNHVLDWGTAGLLETLDVLDRAGIACAGAGRNIDEASAPAVFPLQEGNRLLVFSCGTQSAGIPREWAASHDKPGVWLVDILSPGSVVDIAEHIAAFEQPGDLVLLSVHWGDNWGYEVPPEQRSFAQSLIDLAGVDIVHGHSSHHVKGIEVYHERPILYGCGDLISDYEGLTGREAYRGDLGLLYFPTLDLASGALMRLEMVPTRLQNFTLTPPSQAEITWLADLLKREGARLGTSVRETQDHRLELIWPGSAAPAQ